MEVGFGVNTVFAIKSDGTLWAWGREAHVYTGASDPAQDSTPVRVGTDSDWGSLSATTGWWCLGLTKKDGSLWMMDASEGQSSGPQPPYKQVRFGRVGFKEDYAAYAGGAAHAAAPGVHGPIGVILTPQGEVWTWGMVLGDPLSTRGRAQALAVKLANCLHLRIPAPAPPPVFRKEPWPLRNE